MAKPPHIVIPIDGYTRDEEGIIIPNWYRTGCPKFKAKYSFEYKYIDKGVRTYYLYRFGIKGSPFFYIGLTENIRQRKAQHIHSVYKSIAAIENNKPALNEAYLILAKEVIKQSRQNDVTKVATYTILNQCNSFADAVILEDNILVSFKGNKFLLNRLYKSGYSAINFPLKRIAVLVRNDGLPIAENISIKGV